MLPCWICGGETTAKRNQATNVSTPVRKYFVPGEKIGLLREVMFIYVKTRPFRFIKLILGVFEGKTRKRGLSFHKERVFKKM